MAVKDGTLPWASEAAHVLGAALAVAGVVLVDLVGDVPAGPVLVLVGAGALAVGAGVRISTTTGDRTRALAEGGLVAALGVAVVALERLLVDSEAATVHSAQVALVGAATAVAVGGRILEGTRDRAGALLAGVGIALAIAGGSAWFVGGALDGLPTTLLGAGGLALVGFAFVEGEAIGQAPRSFAYGTGAFVLVLLAAALAVGTYALAERNDETWDLTRDRQFALSDQAVRVAGGLPFDVKVTAFFRPRAPGRRPFEDLVDRFHEANPRIVVEWVDPLAEPLRAKQADVTGDHGTVVLDGNGRTRRVDWEITEEDLVRELLLLQTDVEHVVCWSTGHGEPDPDDETSEAGLGAIRSELERLNYRVVRVSIGQEGVPRTCGLVVLAHPEVDFFPYEQEALAAFVAEGGRAFVLLDPFDAPDLAADLERYGVVVGDDVVVDVNERNHLLGVEDPSFVVLPPDRSAEHPITRNLGAPIVFPVARSVRVNREAMGVELVELLRTSRDAWAETTPDAAAIAPDPGEIVGDVPMMALVVVQDPKALGVAAPTPPDAPVPEGLPDPRADAGRGVPADFAPEAGGRLAVVGDWEFATAGALLWGNNRDLFLNTVAWLVDEEEQIGERPEKGETLEISSTADTLLCLVSVVLVPGSAMAVALVTLLRRRFL